MENDILSELYQVSNSVQNGSSIVEEDHVISVQRPGTSSGNTTIALGYNSNGPSEKSNKY